MDALTWMMCVHRDARDHYNGAKMVPPGTSTVQHARSTASGADQELHVGQSPITGALLENTEEVQQLPPTPPDVDAIELHRLPWIE